MRAGMTQFTQFAIGARDAAMRGSRTGQFLQPVRCRQRDVLRCDKTVPVAAPVQEVHQGPGDLPGVLVQTGGGCGRDRGFQARPLNFEPGQRLVIPFEGFWHDSQAPRRQPNYFPMPVEDEGGGVPGAQIVVEYPANGSSALGVLALGLLGGIRAQQIMQRETAGRVFGYEPGLSQFAQRKLDPPGL